MSANSQEPNRNPQYEPPAPAAAVRFHDDLADTWDAAYGSGAFKDRAMLVERLLDALSVRGQKWLDAGCGSGYFSRALSDRGAEVIGLDASASMIANAARLASAYGLSGRMDFRTVDTIECIDCASDKFDGVLCLSVIEYLAKPAHALREITRMVKPGGIVIISVPHRHSLVRRTLQLARMASIGLGSKALAYLDLSTNTYTQPQLETALEEVGLRALEFHRFDPILPRMLLRVMQGSLIFVVARRQT